MASKSLPRRIAAVGWSTIGLGVLCLLLAVMDVVVPVLLRHLSQALGDTGDASRPLLEAFGSGAALSASLNAAFGAALVVIGFGVAWRSRWAHRALEIACWASIVAVVALARPMLAPIYAFFGSETTGRPIAVVAVLLVVAQVVAVLWFLRFWGQSDVRDAFR